MSAAPECVNCSRPVGWSDEWSQWFHLEGGRLFCDESLRRFATAPAGAERVNRWSHRSVS